MPDSGWYPDPDDAMLERFWDGVAWTTTTRPRTTPTDAVPPPAAVPPTGYAPPTGYGPPAEHAPPAGYGPPPGFPPAPGYPGPAPYAMRPVPMGCSWGRRAVAYLIDTLLGAVPILIAYGLFVGLLLTAFTHTDHDGGGGGGGGVVGVVAAIVMIAAVVWTVGFNIWNLIIRQGRTGQSLGKQKLRIRLVRDADGLPLGGGACFLRLLVAGAFSNFTCGIGGLLDLLWPLWDPNRKRLIDKWLNYSVVDA
jgi:hypothetical protein